MIGRIKLKHRLFVKRSKSVLLVYASSGILQIIKNGAIGLEKFDVIVLGAGAAGLISAITAGQRGRKVLLLDSSNKIGKKILMSGGGRCNFTNYAIESDNYICRNPHFVKSAISQYTQWDFIALVEKYQIPYHERSHGQLFCDDSAKDILNMLKSEAAAVGVDIRAKCQCQSVSYNQNYFLNTSLGKFQADSLVVATGGLSIPSLGGSGFGYDIARQFKLDVLPVRAGLVPVTFSDWFKAFTESMSGIAVDAVVTAGNWSFRERILFTHRGLSGPSILQISNYWQPGNVLTIDLLPEIDANDWLLDLKASQVKQILKNILSKELPAKLVELIGERFWPQESVKPMVDIPDKSLFVIAEKLNNFDVKPSGTEGYRTAEVTIGGVNTDSISSKTMECKDHPGLFFIGEVLDVTGHLGGYNFQWAWSSGYLSGLHC
ncbi:MAG: putative Rossmann fold flavoprotein [Gammaproteobacteria bacterium]